MDDKIEYSRLVVKRCDATGVVPTIPTGTTLSTFTNTDILPGEFYGNLADNKLWWRSNSGIVELATAAIPTLDDVLASGDTSNTHSINLLNGDITLFNGTFYGDGSGLSGITSSATFTGGTVTGPTEFAGGLTATTISATTYLGLPISIDTYITGGTYSTGTATFTNNTGGTFNVTGLYTGQTNFMTGSTLNYSVKALNDSEIVASGDYSFVTGFGTSGTSICSYAEGLNTLSSNECTHAEGYNSIANGFGAHAQNQGTLASGQNTHAEGYLTKATGNNSHSEGESTVAGGMNSHAEGYGTSATTANSHAEGWGTKTTGIAAHAQNQGTLASGEYSHAEGLTTTASGNQSHSQGRLTIASGMHSHAGGYSSTASGIASFVHGYNSYATAQSTIVLGENLNGTVANTVYVNKLNIKSVPSGTSVNNLGVDASGNIVIGTTGSTAPTVLKTKSGVVAYTSFTGSPYSYNVVFTTAFTDALYSPQIIGVDSRSWSVSNITANGFRIETNSSTILTNNVYWTATKHGEN